MFSNICELTTLSFVCILGPQILELAHNNSDIEKKVHDVIDRYADRGLRSLAVARQVNQKICNENTQ